MIAWSDMPAYKTTYSFYEDRVGPEISVVVVGDTYEAVTNFGTAIEVPILDWDSVKHDLDKGSGQMTPSQLSFMVHGDLATTDDERDCVSFLLEAQSESVYRFVGLFLATGSMLSGELDFKGRISSNIGGDGRQWRSAEFASTTGVTVKWKFSATSFGVGTLDGITVKQVADAIDGASISADRLGWFKDGNREGRFCDLVSIDALMDAVLEQCQTIITDDTGSETFMVFDSSEVDWYPIRGRWIYWTYRGSKLRYSNHVGLDPISGLSGPIPWDEVIPEALLERGTTDRLYVNWRLLKPTTEAEMNFGWQRYKSVSEMIYALAIALGVFVEWGFSTDTLTLRFRRKGGWGETEMYVRDTTKDDIKISGATTTDKGKPVLGASTPLVKEGWRQYNYEGGDSISRTQDGVPPEGDFLAVTISPTWRMLQRRGNDDGKEVDAAMFPHNGVFWNTSAIPPSGDLNGTLVTVEHSARGIHTGLYWRTTADSAAWKDMEDLDGLEIITPITGIATAADGTGQIFRELAPYINAHLNREQVYQDNERQLSYPGWGGFKSDAIPYNDWRNCRVGHKVNLDDAYWLAVGVERKREPATTSLRLQNAERFNVEGTPFSATSGMGAPTGDIVPEPGDFDPVTITKRPAGGTIAAGDIVTGTMSGMVIKSIARHDHRDTVLGVALNGGTTGVTINVQQSGRVVLPESLDFTTGVRIFLRTGTPNMSESALTAKTADEDIVLEVGTMIAEGVLRLNLRPAMTFYPPISIE